MFFISGRADENNYYVMDTEDGIEELLHYTDIANAVIDKGIQIKGVKIKRDKHGYTKNVSFKVCTYPLKFQSLLKTISGVEIKDVDGYIVSITAKKVIDARIKLSDYYKGVRIGVLDSICILSHNSKATLIFDDKLDIPLEPLSKKAYISVDITNLSNDTTAYNFYKYVPHEYIIDKPERRLSFILDLEKDPNTLKSLGIPDKYIQAGIDRTLKTLVRYFNGLKLEQLRRVVFLYDINEIGFFLRVDKKRLVLLSYYVEYGVDEAKEIAYKLLDRIKTELGVFLGFSDDILDVLPKLKKNIQ